MQLPSPASVTKAVWTGPCPHREDVEISLGKTSMRSQAWVPLSGGIGTLRVPWGHRPWDRVFRKELPTPTAPPPRVCGATGGARAGRALEGRAMGLPRQAASVFRVRTLKSTGFRPQTPTAWSPAG